MNKVIGVVVQRLAIISCRVLAGGRDTPELLEEDLQELIPLRTFLIKNEFEMNHPIVLGVTHLIETLSCEKKKQLN